MLSAFVASQYLHYHYYFAFDILQKAILRGVLLKGSKFEIFVMSQCKPFDETAFTQKKKKKKCI